MKDRTSLGAEHEIPGKLLKPRSFLPSFVVSSFLPAWDWSMLDAGDPQDTLKYHQRGASPSSSSPCRTRLLALKPGDTDSLVPLQCMDREARLSLRTDLQVEGLLGTVAGE